MNGFMLLQASQTVAAKSADMLEKDPHGVIITLVSVLVVFAALVVLYFAYTFIGKISSGQISFKFPERQRKAKKAEEAFSRVFRCFLPVFFCPPLPRF